jgi:hypothetical protein
MSNGVSGPEEATLTKEPQGDVDMQEVTLQIPYPDAFIYSNCAAFSISQMDIRIGFAEALPDRKAYARVGIVMAPEHAAILALNLLGQVHAYEQTFGMIRVPEWQARKARAIAQRATESQQPVADNPPQSAS